MENIPKASEVHLIFTDDLGIKEYNCQYRQLDTATDVLSFPQFLGKEEIPLQPLPGMERTPLGDIIISYPRGLAQADAYGHSPERELSFLSLHGFLHLLGYDHENEEEREEMEKRSDEILASLGVER